jgi:hypothetical protein
MPSATALQTDKAKVPKDILKRYEKWKGIVEFSGPEALD